MHLTLINDCDGFTNKRTSKKIIEILAKLKPDIVHLHNLHGYWLDTSDIINYLKHIEVKVVWTFA